MPVNHGIQLIDLDSIVVAPREERQRKDLTGIDELMDSIRRVGLINAVVLRRDRTLVAGERRFTAYIRLREAEPDNANWRKIPYRYLDELDEFEADIVELEENIRREQLPWKDEATTAVKLHEKYSARAAADGTEWTLEETAKHIGYSVPYVSKALQVGRALLGEDHRIAHCESIGAAYNIINRAQSRAIADELSNLVGGMKSLSIMLPAAVEPAKAEEPKVEASAEQPKAEEPPAPSAPILNIDFRQWVQSYEGQPFNLIHCDFPYGINHQDSRMGYSKSWGGAYADSEDVYWDLCGHFCENLDKIAAPSSHIVFWFSMAFYRETLDFFAKHAPSLVINPFPLIWGKNKGIVPDPTRGPRRCYETALFMARGDRKIIQPVHNFIELNAEKDTHISEKPVEMLRHYFRMVVDKNTRLLDPTCGSGSALRAAHAMGAKEVLGLELNPEFAKDAANRFNLASLVKV